MRAFLIALLSLGVTAGVSAAQGDADKGAKVFKQCMACHTADAETNKVGPHLKGLLDRPAAAIEGYAYSEAMKAFAVTGAKWDEATLLKYLEKPRDMVPKSKMAFPGLKKEEDRIDLVAYLKTKM
jgi:cytochrome c